MGLNVKTKNAWITENFDLLNAIRRYHTSDKKQLAKALGLSWPTVNNMISRIFDYNNAPVYIDENGVFCIESDFGYFVGISVGGAETQISILDFSLKPVNIIQNNDMKKLQRRLSSLKAYKNTDESCALACFNTPQYPQDISLLCNKIIEIVLDIFENSDNDLLGIGLTFPGIFGSSKSDSLYEVGFCPNLSRLVGLSLMDLFDQRNLNKISGNFISFVLSHDTDAVTVFEKENLYKENSIFNQYSNKSNYACIFLDIGLGMGLIIENTLLKGACHSVGEIGHLIAPPLNFDNDDISPEEKKTIRNILKEKHSFNCYCGVKNCLEHEIRTKVFGCNSQKEFLEKTNNKKLIIFHEKYPTQYKIFKQYLSYLFNLLINILNIDVIILSGRIFNRITPLKFDIELIKMSSGLAPSTNACKVVFGSGRDDVVALGGAAMSFFNLELGENANLNTGKRINIKWPL